MRRSLLIALSCMLLASASFLAGAAYSRQSKQLKIRDLMTDSEFKASGLWKISSWEEKALDEWITRYHERVTKEALGEPYEGEEPEDLKGKQKGEICDTAPMPKGWVKVGDEWNPTKCRKTSGIEYNVWYIERYGDKPVGTEMTVCTRTPTPEGWKETGRKWNPTTCHPNDFDNVKTIKRVE